MYPKILRSLIFPALDRANGTEITKTLSFLEESQWWTLDQIETMQREKLDAIVDYTRRESSFYRDYWENAPDEKRAASDYPALDGLPVVTKNDLRPHGAEFPLSAYRGKVFTNHTSGSTGEPMVYHRSAEQESWFWALRFRMWQWGGYKVGEHYLTLNLNARTALKKRFQDVLFRCSYHGFNANSHDVDAAIRDIQRYKIKHLNGYASSLWLLAKALRERGIEKPGVTTIMATGDTLFPEYRQVIEEVFGAPVLDYYGAGGEGFHILSQCGHGNYFHTHGENAVTEVLKNGRPARPGEMGEIVVTELDNRAMPLVRYATQDMAVVSARTECPCGRQTRFIDSVEGRVPDIVFAPDGTHLVVHFFTILFEYIPEIRQFQVVQREPDRIIARIVQAEGYRAEATEKHIRDSIAKATNGSLAVDFDYVDDIPLARSMKRRFVISELASSPFSVSGAPVDDETRATGSGDEQSAPGA